MALDPADAAGELISRLRLIPHPEGGHYRETYRHRPAAGGRGALTLIYYLLQAGEHSAWHRIDAIEVWHYYAGAALRLSISGDGRTTQPTILGIDVTAGQRPHAVVPAGAWQTAESLGAWTLVGCTVAPAFHFEGFELAEPEWRPSLSQGGRS